MCWENIAGHIGIVTMLRTMLQSERIPHALLFAGPAGVGKMMTARIFAAGLLCSDERAEKPCGDCQSCRQVAQDAHPDFSVLTSDGTSIKIDQIRSLQHEASLAPYHGLRRAIIIEDAERLTIQAANSLLKILEEPPTETVFILTATSAHLLPTTVISRCRIFSFQTLPAAALTELLIARGTAVAAAEVAVRLSGGRVGKALTLLAPEGRAERDHALAILAMLPSGGPELIWKTAAALDKLEAKDLADCLTYLGLILRDLAVLLTGQERLIFNLDLAEKLQAMVSEWRTADLFGAVAAVTDTQRALTTNANVRLACEALLIKLRGAAKEGLRFADSCGNTV